MLKTVGLGALLDVEMSKKCTALWREAHLEVKSVKNWRSRSTFGSWDVEKVHGVVARAKHISKSKVLKTEGLGDILDVQTSFCVVGGVDCASTEKWLKREGFVNKQIDR